MQTWPDLIAGQDNHVLLCSITGQDLEIKSLSEINCGLLVFKANSLSCQRIGPHAKPGIATAACKVADVSRPGGSEDQLQ